MGMRKSRDFSQRREGPRQLDLLKLARALLQLQVKKVSSKKLFKERKKKLSIFFNVPKHDYNLAVNIHFWARSMFNSFDNFNPLMANDGSLKS